MPDTIQHITAFCPILTTAAYVRCHDQAANTVHQKLILKYNLIHEKVPYYNYWPVTVLRKEPGNCTMIEHAHDTMFDRSNKHSL